MKNKINTFETLLDNLINELPNNRFMKLEFDVFDNSSFGGKSFEFMSMNVTYLTNNNEIDNSISQECYDICKANDLIKYNDYISLAMNKTMNDERIKVIDNR